MVDAEDEKSVNGIDESDYDYDVGQETLDEAFEAVEGGCVGDSLRLHSNASPLAEVEFGADVGADAGVDTGEYGERVDVDVGGVAGIVAVAVAFAGDG